MFSTYYEHSECQPSLIIIAQYNGSDVTGYIQSTSILWRTHSKHLFWHDVDVLIALHDQLLQVQEDAFRKTEFEWQQLIAGSLQLATQLTKLGSQMLSYEFVFWTTLFGRWCQGLELGFQLRQPICYVGTCRQLYNDITHRESHFFRPSVTKSEGMHPHALKMRITNGRYVWLDGGIPLCLQQFVLEEEPHSTKFFFYSWFDRRHFQVILNHETKTNKIQPAISPPHQGV